jgi:hypothetical protein
MKGYRLLVWFVEGMAVGLVFLYLWGILALLMAL